MNWDLCGIFIKPWPALLAVGFAAPGLALAGLALGVIPVIIHILNRRRYKIHRWAAMEYLLEALRRNRRRLKFEHWILMIIRCSALLLAGLALARPMGCAQGPAGALLGQASRLNVIVIDNSGSMAWQCNRPDARTNLERAKKLAGELTKRLAGSHDAVCVITTAGGEKGQILVPTYDLDAAGGVIAQVMQRYTTGDLPGTLSAALDMAEKNRGFSGKRLFIFTDSTRPLWQGETAAEALRQMGSRLAQSFQVSHINVAEAAEVNAAVTEVRQIDNVATTNIPLDLLCRPKTFGDEHSVNLQWRNGNKVLQSHAGLLLKPDTPEQILPQVSFTEEGAVAVTARIEPPDRLPEDDEMGLAFIVRKQLSVLVVEGEKGTTPLDNPAAFIQLALSPTDEEQKKMGAVKVELASEMDISGQVFGKYDAVILAGAARPGSSEAKQLRAYVQAGGTLIMFMGEGVSLEAYNQGMLAEGLLPGRIISLATLAEGQEPFRFDFKPDAALHPLLHIFRGEKQSGLGTTRIFTYARVQPDGKANVQRVLNMTSGDPAITLHTLGKGKVVFFATSADTRWTTLPAKPAYVALLNEILLGTIDSDSGWMNLPAASRLQVPRRLVGRLEPRLSDPAGHPMVLTPGEGKDAEIAFTSEPLEHPGMYRLQIDGRSIPISVRFPASESDLTVLPPAAIRKALGDIAMDQENDKLPAQLIQPTDEADFGWSILAVVLVLLGAECFLAMWFRK